MKKISPINKRKLIKEGRNTEITIKNLNKEVTSKTPGVINEVSTYKSKTKFPINEAINKVSTTKMITEDFINETII